MTENTVCDLNIEPAAVVGKEQASKFWSKRGPGNAQNSTQNDIIYLHTKKTSRAGGQNHLAQIFTINQTSSITSYFIIARLEPDLGDCYRLQKSSQQCFFLCHLLNYQGKMHFIFDFYNQSVNSCAGQLSRDLGFLLGLPMMMTLQRGDQSEPSRQCQCDI